MRTAKYVGGGEDIWRNALHRGADQLLDVLSLPNFKYEVSHKVINDRQYQELLRREHNKDLPKN